MAGVTIVAADSTADDTVYLLGREIDNSLSLYTNDLAGTSTLVGPISGLPTGVSVGNFAIATLLASERPGDDPEEPSGGDSGGSETGGSGGGDREPEDSEGADTVVPSPLPPASAQPAPTLAPTGPGAAIGVGSTLVGLSLGTGVGVFLGLGLTAGLLGSGARSPKGGGQKTARKHPRAHSERA